MSKVRHYHVVSMNDKTGSTICMSRPDEPMTHTEACTFKGNLMVVKGHSLMLVEV